MVWKAKLRKWTLAPWYCGTKETQHCMLLAPLTPELPMYAQGPGVNTALHHFFSLLCSLIFVTWCCYFLWISNRVFLRRWCKKQWLMCGKRKIYLFEVYKLIKYVPGAVFWWRTNQTQVCSMNQTDHAAYERCHCKPAWNKTGKQMSLNTV